SNGVKHAAQEARFGTAPPGPFIFSNEPKWIPTRMRKRGIRGSRAKRESTKIPRLRIALRMLALLKKGKALTAPPCFPSFHPAHPVDPCSYRRELGKGMEQG